MLRIPVNFIDTEGPYFFSVILIMGVNYVNCVVNVLIINAIPPVTDPEAKKPSDWDEEMDGEWEAPLVDNPACAAAPGCGAWQPPSIANPNYKVRTTARDLCSCTSCCGLSGIENDPKIHKIGIKAIL